MFAFPPLTPLVKKLLIACGAMFVLEVLLEYGAHLPVPEFLALSPGTLGPSLLWQVFTWPLVQVPTPGSQWSFLINLVFFWLIVSPFELRFGERRTIQALLASCVGSGLLALLVGVVSSAVFHIPVGVLFGLQSLVFGVLVAMVTAMRTGQISLFGVIPMRAWHAVAFTLGLSALNFVMTHDPVPFAGDAGAVLGGYLFGRWLVSPRTPKMRKSPPKAGLRMVKGGRADHDDPAGPPKWLN